MLIKPTVKLRRGRFSMGNRLSSSKSQTGSFTAYVNWPNAPLTDRLVRDALAQLEPQPEIITSLPDSDRPTRLLQWSTYDVLDHDMTLFQKPGTQVLTSAYTIRKALIRKHFLSRSIQHYLAKNPDSVLKHGVPRTWEIELSFIDELDEMWSDELYDLGAILDNEETWMILKPAMASRGMGIRLFHTKAELEAIFQEFEDDDDEEDGETKETEDSDTGVATSQLRHFVIQVAYLQLTATLQFSVPLCRSINRTHCYWILQRFHLRVRRNLT